MAYALFAVMSYRFMVAVVRYVSRGARISSCHSVPVAMPVMGRRAGGARSAVPSGLRRDPILGGSHLNAENDGSEAARGSRLRLYKMKPF